MAMGGASSLGALQLRAAETGAAPQQMYNAGVGDKDAAANDERAEVIATNSEGGLQRTSHHEPHAVRCLNCKNEYVTFAYVLSPHICAHFV